MSQESAQVFIDPFDFKLSLSGNQLQSEAKDMLQKG